MLRSRLYKLKSAQVHVLVLKFCSTVVIFNTIKQSLNITFYYSVTRYMFKSDRTIFRICILMQHKFNSYKIKITKIISKYICKYPF